MESDGLHRPSCHFFISGVRRGLCWDSFVATPCNAPVNHCYLNNRTPAHHGALLDGCRQVNIGANPAHHFTGTEQCCRPHSQTLTHHEALLDGLGQVDRCVKPRAVRGEGHGRQCLLGPCSHQEDAGAALGRTELRRGEAADAALRWVGWGVGLHVDG